MLHNTGSYGPSDAPVSRPAHHNMPPISNHLNMAQNGNNLGKMAQPSVPTPSGHFNLPDYSGYSHAPLNMSPHISHLPNYQPMGFQHHYMTQNSTPMSNLPWQNGMLPMNLNVQHDQSANMMNYYTNFEKRFTDPLPSEFKDTHLRKEPLNIPQVPTKTPIRQPSVDNHGYNDPFKYNLPTSNYNYEMSPKPQERFQLDSTRRQNIENTVRLIENILINTTSKSKTRISVHEKDSAATETTTNDKNLVKKVNSIYNVDQFESNVTNLSINTTAHTSDVNKPNVSTRISSKTATSTTAVSSPLKESVQTKANEELGDSKKESDASRKESDDFRVESYDSRKETEDFREDSDDSQESDDGSEDGESDGAISNEENQRDAEKESDLKVNVVIENQDKVEQVTFKIEEDEPVIAKVEVKIESSCVDMDFFQPFLRDQNGLQRDEVDLRIIDSETSVEEAAGAAKNNQKSNACYECPNCTLLFKHPKRFLIHTKWHSFGMTYEKRAELAKLREQRKNERREARAIERMNSNEVKDQSVAGKVFRCSDCDKVFTSKSSLKTHRKREHATRTRDCRICGQTVMGWNALRAHIATHTSAVTKDDEANPWQCTDCPKRFKYSHSLAKHRDTHKEKIHGCPECPKKYGSQYLLKLHMKCHERVQKGTTFACTYCGKGFYECYSLQVHERTHRNERPFLCEICNANFGTNSSLKRHMKVSHNSAKPHECSVCHRCFSTPAIRDKHAARAHANPEDFKYPCTDCDCKYLKLKDLQKHMNKIHPKNKRRKRRRSDSDEDYKA